MQLVAKRDHSQHWSTSRENDFNHRPASDDLSHADYFSRGATGLLSFSSYQQRSRTARLSLFAQTHLEIKTWVAKVRKCSLLLSLSPVATCLSSVAFMLTFSIIQASGGPIAGPRVEPSAAFFSRQDPNDVDKGIVFQLQSTNQRGANEYGSPNMKR